jgi:hypothetical protein
MSDDDNEMDKAKELTDELALSRQFDELEDSEKVADELFWCSSNTTSRPR